MQQGEHQPQLVCTITPDRHQTRNVLDGEVNKCLNFPNIIREYVLGSVFYILFNMRQFIY